MTTSPAVVRWAGNTRSVTASNTTSGGTPNRRPAWVTLNVSWSVAEVTNPPLAARRVRFRRRDGGELWAHVAASAIVADDGSYLGSLALVTDITARKRAEVELARLAWHDALTGLPNRALLLERIGEALTRQARTAGTVGLLFVDLDQFKAVNDSLGHATRCSPQVADRLRRAVRDGDIVARLGGDEFVIVAEHLADEFAVDLAERVLGALADPIKVCGLDIVVTASIGVTLADPPAVPRPDARTAAGRGGSNRETVWNGAPAPEALLHDADMAMYQAKARGRDCWHLYDGAAAGHRVDRLRLLGELRHALANGGLQLHYQPPVDLRTDTVMGFEALVRWQPARPGLPVRAAPASLRPYDEPVRCSDAGERFGRGTPQPGSTEIFTADRRG